MELQVDRVRLLLEHSNGRLSAGDAHGALESVVEAVRALGLSPASFPALSEAMATAKAVREGGGGDTAAPRAQHAPAAGVGACVDGLAALLSQFSLVSGPAHAASQPSTATPDSSRSGGCAGAASTSRRACAPAVSLAEALDPWQLADAHHRGQVQRRAAEEWQAARHDPGGDHADADSAMDTDDAPAPGVGSLSSGMAAMVLHGAQQQVAEAPVGAPPPGSGAAPLDECARAALAQCALADGSSYVCGACGGVVQRTRAQQHDAMWCPATHHHATV